MFSAMAKVVASFRDIMSEQRAEQQAHRDQYAALVLSDEEYARQLAMELAREEGACVAVIGDYTPRCLGPLRECTCASLPDAGLPRMSSASATTLVW